MLAAGIGASSSLQLLHLEFCRLPDDAEAYPAVFEGIQRAPSLSELKLQVRSPQSIPAEIYNIQNNHLISLDLRWSQVTPSTLRAITASFGPECSLRTLKIGNLKLLRHTGRPTASSAVVATVMKGLFQMSVRCPTLTEIDMLQFRTIAENSRNRAGAMLRKVDMILRFNRKGRGEIGAANVAARKGDAITILADFSEDLDCLYEAVKLVPILFEKQRIPAKNGRMTCLCRSCINDSAMPWILFLGVILETYIE